MKQMIISITALAILGFSCQNTTNDVNQQAKGADQQTEQQAFKTINFPSKDSLLITADVYMTDNENAPFILLFHQAGFSRGEYREIAPKLNELGFNCMAIDQRSGKEVNGVANLTFTESIKYGLPTKYQDAYPDLLAAFEYVIQNYKAKKFIIWGSSYSASLTFVLGNKFPDKIDKILAFSPGEYFTHEGKTISEFAAEVTCPVFITSAKAEHEKWQNIYEQIRNENKAFYLPEKEGYHGSRALWDVHHGHNRAWKAVTDFLLK